MSSPTITVASCNMRKAIGTDRRRVPHRVLGVLRRRTAVLAALMLLPAATTAAAHPSRGIVIDRGGTVYFSDLVRVWRIDGNRLRLVRSNPGTHTHAMAIDSSGNIVWDESRYNSADESYVETVWQLSGNRLSRRFGPAARLTRGVGIIRDRNGCTLHSDQAGRGGASLVHRLCAGRAPQRLFGSARDDALFRPALVNDIAGVALARDGSFVFRHGNAVRAIDSAGRVRVLAQNIARENFGIAVDPAGGVLISENRNRRVLRFAGGRRSVVATSPAGWGPTGVTASRDAVYVLEASDYRRGQPIRMRVRRIAQDGRARVLAEVVVP